MPGYNKKKKAPIPVPKPVFRDVPSKADITEFPGLSAAFEDKDERQKKLDPDGRLYKELQQQREVMKRKKKK